MNVAIGDRAVLDLIEHVYAAACAPQQWVTFAESTHAAVPGAAFNVLVGIEGTRVDANSSVAGIAQEHLDSYIAHYQFLNPYNALFQSLKQGKVYTATELIEPNWIKRQAFYHEWLKPAGNFTHGAALIVARDEQRLMRVGFDIPETNADLEPACANLLARLGPHIARAFEVNARLKAGVLAENTVAAMLEGVEGGALLVTNAARVSALNSRAERLARGGALFRIDRDKRIRFRAASHQDAYRKALASAFEPGLAGANAFAVEGNAEVATVMVLPLRLATLSMAAMGTQPCALLLLQGSQAPKSPRALLRSLCGLTRAEAELVSQLASGRSVRDAAEQLGITATTARNQLAAAMAKMGVHRQAELVSRVASLTPRLRTEAD